MTLNESHFVAGSVEEFDAFIAKLIGEYLGRMITVEELARRFYRLSRASYEIFNVPRKNQAWYSYDGRPTTFEVIVQGDLESFSAEYTLGPVPERSSGLEPGEYGEPELRNLIVDDWIPQLERNYGPGVVTIIEPGEDYVIRRSELAAELVEIHRRYLDGETTGLGFANNIIYDFQDRRNAENLHHHQFEAAIWDGASLEQALIDAERDEFEYDGRGPAQRRLDAILAAFPELR